MQRKKMILVIDDIDTGRKAIVSTISNFKEMELIEIIESDRVNLAEQKVRLASSEFWYVISDLKVDFILTDNGLGSQEGVEFLEAIEQHDLPSILISGGLGESIIRRAREIKGCIGSFGRYSEELAALTWKFEKWLKPIFNTL
jgi:CheY-like chemotaxis protein